MNFGFDKKKRLLSAHEFKEVFDNPSKKIHSEHLLLIIKTNNLGHPRLGLAITKKKLKHAVARNHLKRLAREHFRLSQHQLDALDMVLIVKKTYTKDYFIADELTLIFNKATSYRPSGLGVTDFNGVG